MPDQDNIPFHLRLTQLHHSGRWDRLAAVAADALQQDATNPVFHYYRALALGHQNQVREALPHVDFILKHEPTAAENHHLASIIHSGLGNLTRAANHIDTAVGINPDHPVHHYEAARISALRLKIDDGKRHISRARELAPDDPDIAHLDITLRGASQSGSTNAWCRVKEFEDALALDPENARLHDSLGDVYLNELESPRLAEQHYRQAVAAKPANRTFQRDLFNAISRRDPIYRTLSLPSRAFVFLGNLFSYYRTHPWHFAAAMILGAIPLACLLAWLLCATVFFWPPSKLYEWLLLRQIRQTAGASPARLRAWFTLRRVPLIARIVIVPTLAIAYWTLLIGALSLESSPGSPTYKHSLREALVIFAIHLAFVLAAAAYRKISATTTRPKT